MRNAITKTLQESTAIATSYGTPVEQPAELGALFAHGGQVVLSFQRTNGTSVTFKIDEYFGEATGWVAKTEDDGTNLNLFERTSTLSAFQYAFPTVAEKVRVYLKGAGSEEVALELTVGDIN